MVRLTRIYTRTGDDGSTGLVDGSRRTKDDPRLQAYGSVDELNAQLGVAIEVARACDEALWREMVEPLRRIQNDLFDLGADLATPGKGGDDLRIVPAQVKWLEDQIDGHNGSLPSLESFVLPGGSTLAAALHVARTVCRRAEREAVALSHQEDIGEAVLTYLNRLSDLLFVLARVANQIDESPGGGDVPWIPGEHR